MKVLARRMTFSGLQRAMKGRNLKELEGAINFVKRNGFEITLANELIEANKILFQVILLRLLEISLFED